MKIIDAVYFNIGSKMYNGFARLRAWWLGRKNPKWFVVEEAITADERKPLSSFRVLSTTQMAKEGYSDTECDKDEVYHITRRVVGKYASYGDAAQAYMRRSI